MERIASDTLHSLYYADMCWNGPLALPLGELSPQVTERVFERVLHPFLNDTVDLRAHRTKIPVDLPVGEAQNLQTKGRQEAGAFRIIRKFLGVVMLRAIHFHDQSGRSTVKIHDESANDPLFVDLYRIFAQKKIPELPFVGVISLRSRRAFSNWVLSFGMDMGDPLRLRCAQPPLPEGEARGGGRAEGREGAERGCF